MNKRFLALVIFVLCTGFVNQTCKDEQCFDRSTKVASEHLPLQGISPHRHLGIRIFTAALYAPGTALSSNSVLSDIPRHLVIRYHHRIKKENFIKIADKHLKKIPSVRWERIRERVQKINSVYENVKPGDEYALTYVPGVGTTLSLNGEPKTLIQGEDFAMDYFGIWLSERSVNQRMTKELLSGEGAVDALSSSMGPLAKPAHGRGQFLGRE